jgi:excisionase family DNA binding protein
VARFLPASYSFVYSLVLDGEIPALKVGRSIRIPRQVFLTWWETQEVIQVVEEEKSSVEK